MKSGGGSKFNDRLLAGQVRSLALDLVMKALQGDDEEFKKQLLLKLATNILPRLNEHSGPEGKPIPILQLGQDVLSNNSDEEDTGTAE